MNKQNKDANSLGKGEKCYITSPLSYLTIVSLADEFRKLFNIDEHEPLDVIDLLENKLPEKFEDFDWKIKKSIGGGKLGYIEAINKRIVITESTYTGACYDNVRERFTIAHEIAHLYLMCYHGGEHSKASLCYKNDKAYKFYKDPEWQANNFAAELLAPIHIIKDMEPVFIAIKFYVSEDTATFQKEKAKKYLNKINK